MNDCIEQASSSGFGWVILVLAVVVFGIVVYRNGWVATEGMLKSLAMNARAKAEKLEAKWKAKQAPATGKTKADRIAEAGALLAAGTITQAIHDAAVAQIAAE